MQARFSDFLPAGANREPLHVTFGFKFLSYQRKSIGIFVTLISFSSLANADCSEAFATKLLDRNFSQTQIIQLCGKISSPPPVVITTEVKPISGAKAAAEKTKSSESAAIEIPSVSFKTEINTQSTPAKNDTPQPSDSMETKNISSQGDYLHLLVDAQKFTPVLPKNPIQSNNANYTKDVIAPAGSCFRIDSDTSPGKIDGTVTGKFVTEESEKPSLNLVKKLILKGCGETLKKDNGSGGHDKQPDHTVADSNVNTAVPPPTNIEYRIEKSDLFAYDRERYGWTYGVLAVPFKFYLGKQNFSTDPTIAPYLGYRIHDRSGSSTVAAFSIGPAFATVNNGAGNVSISGASVALAILTEIKNSFNAGVIVGSDYFSKSAVYPYSGKAWIGVNFGIKAD